MGNGEFENVSGSGINIFSAMSSFDTTPDSSLVISDSTGFNHDVSSDVTIKQPGSAVSVYVPPDRLWMLDGKRGMSYEDVRRFLNAGKWTFTASRDNETRPANDDHCGTTDEQPG
jgi:hypothetical protein